MLIELATDGVLKTIDPYFGMVWDKIKTFELRKNDRNFQIGDCYYLVHYDADSQRFLDRWILVRVVCVLATEHLMAGYVALGIEEIDRGHDSSTEIEHLRSADLMPDSEIERSVKLEKLRVFETSRTVLVDWDYALKVCETLDRPDPDEDRRKITGKSAIVILAEYGAIVHRCSFPPKSVKLAVVVCPPCTWFCPSVDGLDGVFIEPYLFEKFGSGIVIERSDADLLGYSSIDARMDGWNFAAQMIMVKRKTC